MPLDQVVYRCGDFELDTANRIFRKDGTEYTLEPKVFAVLTQLIMRPGELLTREQLLDAVWGHRYVTPSTLNRVIALARRALLGHLTLSWIHFCQSEPAAEQLTAVERLAEKLHDELLRGLAGLARGWLYLAQDDTERALDVLRSVRGLSAESHQHHFIGMYIALALFRQGDLAGAAAEWHESMRKAIAVAHPRGVAGAVEGCGYLTERLGEAEEACRFLGAAEQLRQRTGSPLFSFWFRHNES